MTTYGPFTFDSENDADCQEFTFTSTDGQTTAGVIDSPGTAAKFCHDTNGGNSTDVGPDQGQGGVGDGYLYTECSSPGASNDEYTMTFDTVLDASAEQWQFTFYTCQRGPAIGNNQSTCDVQINESGGGWTTVASFGGSGQDTTDGTEWDFRSVDLSESGTNTDSTTQVRILITSQSATSWHADYGIDTVEIIGTPLGPDYTQASFQGYDDDAGEGSATPKASVNTNWTQLQDENFRVRFLVQENDDVEDLNVEFQLQYNLNAGGWNDVNGSSNVVRSSASAQFADGANTTQQIGSGTFIGSQNGMDEVNGLAGGANLDFTTTINQEVEVEYCVQIRSADTVNADSIQLRVVKEADIALDTYSNTPTITVDAPATGYYADIENLGADHHWPFDGDSNDVIGSANGTDTSIAYTASAIAADATNCASMNARSDRISIPTTTTINNSAQARKAVAGWFMVDDVELPHCRIYGEGNATTNFQFILFAGNSVMLEVRDGATWQIQIYSDIVLVADRYYHLCGVLEGNGYGNEIRFYIDGVEQTAADPSDRQPDDASLAARGVAEFGNPAGTVGLNGVTLLMNSPGDNVAANQVINGHYQHWAAWGDTADAVLTDNEVRETLFERGALADVTISSNTEVNMQTAIDVYADTLRSNAACCIEIEAVSGGGDFTLDLDNITFDPLASIHIRYNGTADTLTIRNTNGADCSIVSAPFGGTINVVTEVTVKVTVQDASTKSDIESARVLLETNPGGVDIIDTTTDSNGEAEVTFDYSSDQAVAGKVRKGSASPLYKGTTFAGTITINGFDQTILLVADE